MLHMHSATSVAGTPSQVGWTGSLREHRYRATDSAADSVGFSIRSQGLPLARWMLLQLPSATVPQKQTLPSVVIMIVTAAVMGWPPPAAARRSCGERTGPQQQRSQQQRQHLLLLLLLLLGTFRPTTIIIFTIIIITIINIMQEKLRQRYCWHAEERPPSWHATWCERRCWWWAMHAATTWPWAMLASWYMPTPLHRPGGGSGGGGGGG